MKNKIYISEYLTKIKRFEIVTDRLQEILRDSLIKIPDAKNEWCRDYMPVKASDGSYQLFSYLPSYLLGNKTFDRTIPDQKLLCEKLAIQAEDRSHITLDGGAIDVFGKKALIADRVIYENSSTWQNLKPNILEEIKTALKLDELIVVPSDPFDFTGHVDGALRFVDENTILVNDHSGMDVEMNKNKYSVIDQKQYARWKKGFMDSITGSGLKTIVLPYTAHLNKNDESAVGVYMNFLLLNDLVVMPAYSNQEENNNKAKEILENAYKRNVVTIYADVLAQEGGVINCVCWNS